MTLSLLRAKLDLLNAVKGGDYYDKDVAFNEQLYELLLNLSTILVEPLQATSTSNITMGVGEHTFNIGPNKRPQVGDRVKMARDVNNIMYGYVVSYTDSETGPCVIEVDDANDIRGGGTYNSWSISFTVGDEGDPGEEYWLAPTEITSAASPVAAGDKAVYLADTTAAAITLNLQAATSRLKVCDSAGLFDVNAVLVYPPAGESIMGGAVNEVYELDQAKAAYEIRRKANGNWRVYKL